jgi:general secretion pathway protein D
VFGLGSRRSFEPARSAPVYQAGNALINGLAYKGSNMTAALSAIDGDSRFKYVAEPSLRVVDGEIARLVFGSEVPTRGAITQDKLGNAQRSIDYKTAGVAINIEPRVLDGMVSLKIGQQISSFALTTSNIDSPTILKRESQTTIAVRPGELVMLAGMDEDRTSSAGSGLSFLPNFMRSNNSDTARSQLVLLPEATPDI